MIAAIWIGLIPVVGKYIVVAIAALLVFAINSKLLVVASFLSCIVLFVFPLFLLGTVTPSLAKYTTDEGESVYNYLQVKEDSKSVNLSTNVLIGVQSVYRKDEALSGMYYDYAMAAPYMAGVKELEENDQDMNLLILGMGSGTYATQLSRYFDNINITGVEIDEKITDLAHEYFELPEDTNVTTYDGRAYLDADNNKYDVIMVDAYQDITIPFQMSSTEFFESVRSHLNPGGVMVVNMNMYFEDDLETEPTINTRASWYAADRPHYQ